jgi:hypothetical protein
MPSASLAQERYVRSQAALGKAWAKKWIRDEKGKKIPRIQHVAKRKPGRPKLPISAVTNDALWKRAQRADNRPKNRGMIRHHVDDAYGRKSPQTVYMSRGTHNKTHKSKGSAAFIAEVKRRRKMRTA